MSSYFRFLRSIFDDILKPSGQEFMRSLPDSLFLGSGFLALVTQNFPLGIFVLALAEIALVQRGLGGLFQSIGGVGSTPYSDACTPGIPSPYLISVVGRFISNASFPSGPVFLIAGAISYIMGSLLNMSDELQALGQTESEWNARIPIGITFSTLFLIGFCIWRVWNSCDAALPVLGSVAMGLAIGWVVYILHLYLFGRDSINFLGIPLLVDRTATGRPIYACAKQA